MKSRAAAIVLAERVAVLALAAAGCGGDDNESEGTTTEASSGGGGGNAGAVEALPASSCSAVYYEGAPLAFGQDFHRSYFNDWLRWAGIEHAGEVRFQPNLVTADAEAGRTAAHEDARRLGAAFAENAAPQRAAA